MGKRGMDRADNPFFEGVYDIVAAIPVGRVISYGRIAAMLGHPRAARLVGRAMRVCPDALPWHRVVMKDGTVTGGAYAMLRRRMLEEENVGFLTDGRVNMAVHAWDG
ncbi:MAG: MGMT family protein [Clostridiales Family XIII bacterium]|jgi:methylated-DNA-protein-cysteine methyltransferase-like protein|nr:MGMT family protein [Clostridiales Family XIII bacterium]